MQWRFTAGSCVPVEELLPVILGYENNRCLETGQVGRYYGRQKVFLKIAFEKWMHIPV